MQRAQLEAVMNTMPDGLLLLDARGQLLAANPAGRLLLPVLRAGQPEELPLTDIGGVRVVPQPYSSKRSERNELELMGQEGETLILEIRGVPADVPGGGWLLTVRDFTRERLRAERERKRQLELSSLYTLSRRLVAMWDSAAVLDTVARHAVETVHVTFCRVLVFREDGFECVAAHGIRPLARALQAIEREPAGANAVYQRVLRSVEPLSLHRGDPTLGAELERELMLDLIKVLFLAPLRAGTDVLGILAIGEKRSGMREPLNAEKLRLVEAITGQAAGALKRTDLHAEMEEAFMQTVLALANAMEARDDYTGEHSFRLAAWAQDVARQLGCDEREAEALLWGTVLHDVGKIGVPDRILRKNGPLDSQEWRLMRRHPITGAEIVAPIRKLADVVPIIRGHHERWDGSGYPDGLKGEDIPLGARIMAVVDVYGSLTDDRPYRAALSHQQALDELRKGSGTHFDPVVLQIFLELAEAELAEELPPL